MLLVFMVVVAIYLVLLGFVLYGGWSNIKFASTFRKGLHFWTLGATNPEHEEKSDGKFSILYGRFQTPPVMPKSKLGRGILRNTSTQKYYDNRYFTSLSGEKKDPNVRPQDEALTFIRERGDFRNKFGHSRGLAAQGLNLEPLEEACYRRKEARLPTLEAYMAFMNFNTSYPVSSSLHQKAAAQGTGCFQSPYASICHLAPRPQPSHKKVRLSRGLWNRSRRRNWATRVEGRELSVILERDESEERASINVSSTRFKCQASDNSSLASSPVLC